MVRRSRVWRYRLRRSFIRQTITRNLKQRLENAGFTFDTKRVR